MLVITRKKGESIRIGEDIVVEVVSIKGKTIRLGIKADPDVLILREEVYNRPSHTPHSDHQEPVMGSLN